MSIEGTGSATDRFGEFLAAGDLNGDGMDDLVIAAPGAASQAGEVSIVFGTAGGGTRPQSVADWTLRGGSSQQIGQAVVVHDVDGDHSADLLVGVPRAGASDEGEIWVFRGPLSDGTPSTIRGRADADYVIVGDVDDEIGSAVAAGDVSDGGPPTPLNTGQQDYAGLGTAVGAAGDLNRDGFDDVVVGEPGYDDASNADLGRVGIGLSTTKAP